MPKGISILDIVDILLVAAFLYKLFATLRDTRAVVLLRGLAVILVIGAVSHYLRLQTISWLFEQTLTVLLVSLPIVFYPELQGSGADRQGSFCAPPGIQLVKPKPI